MKVLEDQRGQIQSIGLRIKTNNGQNERDGITGTWDRVFVRFCVRLYLTKKILPICHCPRHRFRTVLRPLNSGMPRTSVSSLEDEIIRQI